MNKRLPGHEEDDDHCTIHQVIRRLMARLSVSLLVGTGGTSSPSSSFFDKVVVMQISSAPFSFIRIKNLPIINILRIAKK